MKLIFSLLVVLNAVPVFSHTEIFQVDRYEVKVTYFETAGVRIALTRDNVLLDSREFSFQWSPHARLRRLAYLFERSLYLIELMGRNSTLYAISLHLEDEAPKLGSVEKHLFPIVGDRGDLEFFEGKLLLIMGYPGSATVFSLSPVKILVSRPILDWPNRVVVCGKNAFIAPLPLRARPSLLGKVRLKNLMNETGNVSFTPVVFPDRKSIAVEISKLNVAELLVITSKPPGTTLERHVVSCE